MPRPAGEPEASLMAKTLFTPAGPISLHRQDLPPEMVASNMAWLKAALAKPAVGGATGAPPSGRNWQSVTQPGG